MVQRIEEFWDGSDLAEPAQRPSTSFNVAPPPLEVLVFDGAQLKCLVFFRCGHVLRLPDSVEDTHHGKSDGLGKKIKLFNDQHAATFRLTGGGKRSQPNTAPSPSKPRTLCQPEFSPDDEPADPLRVWEPTTQLLKGEFEQKHEPLESNAPFISLLHFDG